MSEQDNQYMRRALELASRGLGNTAPNPLVGCVIVNNGNIIGEGWHQKYGEPHAEVNAVKSAAGHSLEGALVYVNLEPCSYHGNTPPCANMLTQLPVKKVFYSHIDPNPKVSGQGGEILREHGIEVETGILEKEARFLNRRFLTYHEKQRPYIILKWAQTSDGFIARENYDSKWISNEHSRKLVHRWRSEEPGIMVGKNTVQYDDPELTVRDWSGSDPVRIVIDPSAKLSTEFKVFSDSGTTLYYHTDISRTSHGNAESIRLEEIDFLSSVFSDLYDKKLQSVIVEGGAFLLNQLINKGWWDEARVFISEKEFGKGIEAPQIDKSPTQEETVSGDRLLTYSNHNYG